MSWLFSQALVAAYSQATSTAGAACAPLNVTPSAHSFWRQGRTMAPSRLSRFGLTCAVLTADRGEALLTWYRADFLARTSARRVQAQALSAHAAAYGAKWPESSAKYCPVTSSWRTHHCLFDAALPASSVILPRWGMTRNGVVYRHPTLERPINATASGLWLSPPPCLSQQTTAMVPDPDRQPAQGMEQGPQSRGLKRPTGLHCRTAGARAGMPWPPEPAVGRVAAGLAHRVDRLVALGNGQVPRVAATAFQSLCQPV